jgi:hypothetical protein
MLQEIMKVVSKKGIMESIKDEVEDIYMRDGIARELGYDKYEGIVGFPYAQGIILMLAPLMV